MLLYPVAILMIILLVMTFRDKLEASQTWNNRQMETALEQGDVAAVVITQNKEVPTGVLRVTLDNGEIKYVNVTDVNAAGEMLAQYEDDIEISTTDVERDSMFLTTLLPVLLTGLLLLLFFGMMNRQAGGGNAKMMNFGKSRARMISPDARRVTFKDVAGLQEEKEDLEEIVSFLKEPSKFVQVGARIPKGVILVGPPGTGKTLLAKAVAGEAGVPFFSISGSDFVEMFVGVGASRVRDLFEEAKKHQPCIVFIDEIDAVARRRGTGMGGGHDEREQTLNQMLVEMDGFGVNEGVIVMAATNRVDILDPAILRPGRFDRQVAVGRPDVRGREEILQVHAKGKPLAEDVDLQEVARTTAGFTGADLENLMNEAAIHAAKEQRSYIKQEDINRSFIRVGIGAEKNTAGFTGADLENLMNEAAIHAAKEQRSYIKQEDINRSFIRVGIGAEKKSLVISEKEKRITAYHEAGHALLFHLLPDVGPVHTISIIPTGRGAAGYTMPLPERDEMFNTKGKMLQNIIVSLGGRVAEELVIGDVTTGASADIKQATGVARAMVTKFGMSDTRRTRGRGACDRRCYDRRFCGYQAGNRRGARDGDEVRYVGYDRPDQL